MWVKIPWENKPLLYNYRLKVVEYSDVNEEDSEKLKRKPTSAGPVLAERDDVHKNTELHLITFSGDELDTIWCKSNAAQGSITNAKDEEDGESFVLRLDDEDDYDDDDEKWKRQLSNQTIPSDFGEDIERMSLLVETAILHYSVMTAASEAEYQRESSEFLLTDCSNYSAGNQIKHF